MLPNPCFYNTAQMNIGETYMPLECPELHSIAVELDQPGTRKRPAHLRDNVVYESIGSRQSPSASDEFKTRSNPSRAKQMI